MYSVCSEKCGDGKVVGSEDCDDGSDDLEGCAAGCKSGSLAGWNCILNGGSGPAHICTEICGDGLIVGSEDFDDGSNNSEGCRIGCKTGVLAEWNCIHN